MKKLLLAGVAACTLGAASAGAADLPARRAAPVFTPPPAFTWSGAYIGVGVGVVGGESIYNPLSSTYLAGPFLAGSDINFRTRDESELIGGIQTGYRWQFGQFVLGFEQDTQFTDLQQRFTLGTRPGTGFAGGDTFTTNLSYLGATRLQAGIAFDRFLVYAAGGLMTGIMDVTASYGATGGVGSPAVTYTNKNKFHLGWTIGGGAEYAFTDNVSIGVDGRYFELERERYNLGAVVSGGGTTFNTNARVSFEGYEVLGRINVKTSGFLGIF